MSITTDDLTVTDPLAEQEVTRMLALLDAISKRLDINDVPHAEIEELKKDVKPEVVLDELDTKAEENHRRTNKKRPR